MTKYENGVANWRGKDLTEAFINYPVTKKERSKSAITERCSGGKP